MIMGLMSPLNLPGVFKLGLWKAKISTYLTQRYSTMNSECESNLICRLKTMSSLPKSRKPASTLTRGMAKRHCRSGTRWTYRETIISNSSANWNNLLHIPKISSITKSYHKDFSFHITSMSSKQLSNSAMVLCISFLKLSQRLESILRKLTTR